MKAEGSGRMAAIPGEVTGGAGADSPPICNLSRPARPPLHHSTCVRGRVHACVGACVYMYVRVSKHVTNSAQTIGARGDLLLLLIYRQQKKVISLEAVAHLLREKIC
ncbi:hypothetical protein EVAR_84437_1 [Eumeta japonica]|uniref:Uncharacterized protein n=1 Tax=Eumeta variegata TaxID=151549 RepID=A0A4C1W097_EUMVA|nr:hypothetical protein EVAR_84437_1 [Eumeta japonica]